MKNWEKKLREITPYVPGDQPDFPDMIKINTNEIDKFAVELTELSEKSRDNIQKAIKKSAFNIEAKAKRNVEVISCVNNTEKGKATVTFKGIYDEEKGLYFGGTKTVTFKIKERDAATNWWDDLTASLQSVFNF